jgi:superfamily II DNA helicase RecQ
MRQSQFSRRIARINVDEVHCIHTAGLPQYGLPPFRPAWGKLKILKLMLSSKVPWIGFSATIPPHIHKTVVSHILRPNYVSICYSSNRENTMYATHPVIGSIENLRNYECFLTSPFCLEKQPHILIFVDDKNLTNEITMHLESRLPAQYQNRGLVRHYHGAMSEEYLKQVHNSFVQEDGSCRILVSDCQGLVNPRGLWVGYTRVGVWVEFSDPPPTPTLSMGYGLPICLPMSYFNL